ncbi:MAG: hypothetical protein ACOX0F_06370 [Syntrophomonadaceae bacterium]|jgi:hypothetical protein
MAYRYNSLGKGQISCVGIERMNENTIICPRVHPAPFFTTIAGKVGKLIDNI